MKHWWWKVLATLLLLYVVVIGLRTPLAPALIVCTPDRISPGDVVVNVWGYNTRFFEGVPSAWISNDVQWVCSNAARVIDDDQVEVRFNVPHAMRAEMSHLVIRTVAHGDLTYTNAFFTEDRGSGIGQAIADGCKPEALSASISTAHASAFQFPDRNILNESIRNLFFHVPMWFTMVVLMAIGVWKSIRVLGSNDLEQDRSALAAVQVGLVFGTFGLITGSLWARVTWETWWTTDPKLNGAAAGVLIYMAYLVLRGSIPEPAKRARLSAIYSIFAFTFMLLFFFVLPRLNAVDSLHPGNGGNPAFNTYDLDNKLRSVFYPACLGWILMGVWMYTLRDRLVRLQNQLADADPS
jgi:heme exporter protein C